MEIGQDDPCGPGLGRPGGRDARDGAGGDHPVERGVVGVAGDAVGGGRGGRVPGFGQVLLRLCHQLGIEIHGDDVVVAESVG